MIKFDKPIEINGKQLRQELRDAGINISDEIGAVAIDGDGNFWVDVDEKNKSKAQEIISLHVPKKEPIDSVIEKLESVGLNIEDLKSALGL